MPRLDALESNTAIHPRVQTLTLDHPWSWLAKGWQDLLASPTTSLGYGIVFVVAGYLLIGIAVVADLFYLFFPLMSGFFLVGPIVAVGLYEISRRRELALPVSMGVALQAWRANGSQFAAFGVVLMLIFLAWMRLTMLIFALLFGGLTPSWENFVQRVFLSVESFPLLVAMLFMGALLSVVVFAISALAVPMLLDRSINAFAAMRFSVLGVKRNLLPMALWASIIVAFTVLGLATFLIGLGVMLPLIGHATWHAYQDTLGNR